MALRCPECGADNAVGSYYCTACESPLLPEAMIPPKQRREKAAGSAAAAEPAAPAATAQPAPEPMPASAPSAPAASAPVPQPAASVLAETGTVSEDGERRYRIILGDTCPICRAVSRISFTRDRCPQIPIAGCREAEGCRCTLPIFASDIESALASAHPTLSALAPQRDTLLPAEILPTPTAPASLPPAPSTSADEAPAPRARSTPAPDWMKPAAITEQRRRQREQLTEAFYQRRIQGIKLQTAPDCCRVCAEVASSIYEPSITPTLPVVGCLNGWQCRCMYGEEPLLLDVHGLEALSRLNQIESERMMRRRKVALHGPRSLHQFVIVVSAAIAVGAILHLTDPRPRGQSLMRESLILIVVSAVCAAVAYGSMQRIRRLPAPSTLDIVCGLGVLIFALYPLLGLRLPPGQWYLRPDSWQNGVSAAPDFSSTALQSLSVGRKLLGLAGLLLFVAGLIIASRSRDYQR